MQKILLAILTLSLISTTLTVSAAPTLAPPKLGEVLKKNEKYDRLLDRKKRSTLSNIGTGGVDLTYHTILSGRSITLTNYDTIDLWVQSVDLGAGAHLQSVLDLTGYDETSGEPLFAKKKLSEVANSLKSKPFSIINGQFFDPNRTNTPLSFGLKEDGIVRTAGADNRNESKNILIISATGARIVPYSWENLRDAPGYFAMVSFTLDQPHYRDEAIGRTYICLQNPNAQNESASILIFTALSMSETMIEHEFPRWGCTRSGTTKLDSSGSTRLWVDSEYIFGKSHRGDPDYRKIPHSIVIWDKE